MTGCSFSGDTTVGKAITILGGRISGGELLIRASDVTVDGMEVTGGNANAQTGNIDIDNASRVTLRNVYVHDAGGACVSFLGTTDSGIYDSELARCAQEGFHGTLNTRLTFARNAIHHNNPNRQYDTGWEAGGGKVTESTGVVWEGNESYANNGPGIWCDIHCKDAVIRGNRVYDNATEGIFFEASDGALIEDNVVWRNDVGGTTWCYDAGILVSSSPNVTVRGNVVAWNGRGIMVISQNHGSQSTSDRSGIRVEDNDVVHATAGGIAGFCADNASNLFTSDSGGAGNRYWSSVAEPSNGNIGRFEWQGQRNTLAAYESTPGETNGRYLTTAEKDALLVAHGVPPSP